MTPSLARTLNALGLVAISVPLLFAFTDQFVNHDLPCPLCLLQRAGFVAAGIGIALNAIEPRPAHYAMAIVSSIVGAAVSLRQIALHVVPGTGGYGDPFLGMHFYTWAFVVFVLIILGSAAMLFLEGQFEPEIGYQRPRLAGLGLFAVALFALIALGNAVSTVAECELGLCPDNPTTYQLFEGQPAQGTPPDDGGSATAQ
ncbi:disulfide bond formation protein B [Microbaculum marinum]